MDFGDNLLLQSEVNQKKTKFKLEPHRVKEIEENHDQFDDYEEELIMEENQDLLEDGQGQLEFNGLDSQKLFKETYGKESQVTGNPIQNEATKLNAKIIKVDTYWNKTSFFIPNVFRLVKKLDDDQIHIFEF